MVTKYKSLSLFKFQKRCSDKASCYNYLVQLKLDEIYLFKKFLNIKFYAYLYDYDNQCTKFSYVESNTVGSLFHQVKFSILKAYFIFFYVSTSKKGFARTGLSRKLALRQKTCWPFKQNVVRAMESSQQFFMTIKVAINDTYIGGQDEKAIGRNERNKKSVVIAKRNIKEVSRACMGELLHLQVREISPYQ
jgi:hypothetical protein